VKPNLRTVIEEEIFARELQAIEGDPCRADEFIDATKTLLASDPTPREATKIRDDPPLWFISCSINENKLAIYYSFDDGTVYLKSITNFQ